MNDETSRALLTVLLMLFIGSVGELFEALRDRRRDDRHDVVRVSGDVVVVEDPQEA